MQVSKMRKPVAGEATGLLKIDELPSTIDIQISTPHPHELQASRLQNRFNLSWPLARLTAELHFGRPA